MMNISIPYGRERLEFQVPKRNLVDVLHPNEITPPDSEKGEIETAIDHPIGTKKLNEIVRPNDRVVIICEDITRPTPADKILPVLLDRLHAAGIANDDILIVMALGSHRPMTEAEMAEKVGQEIFAQVRVVNSEFQDKSKLVDLGRAPGGVRVWIDQRVVAGDIKIGVGHIVPHPGAGYTGGGKIIYPGVAGAETVAQFHLRSALLNRNILGDEENLARQEMEGWIDTVGLDFIINCILTPEDRIYRVVAGHYVKAHRTGVKFSRQVYGVRAREKVDIVVVSAHPADIDFWQGGKGLLSGDLIVKDGGSLILTAPCFEGVGPHPSFLDYCGADNPDRLLNEARQGKVDANEALPLSVGVMTARIIKRTKIGIVSKGLSEEQAKRAKLEYFSDLDGALQAALSRHGRGAKVSVIPYGGHTYPYRV